MASTKYKLGELIEQLDDRNIDGEYGLNDVRGISIQKIFIDTKANMTGVPLKPYKLVSPGDFAYVTVTSRNGEKITLAHNTTDSTYIVSTSYVVFRVKKIDILLPEYLYIYFNRPEFDRYARFNSWGSARETFAWEDMCDIEIDLPPIEIQKKYVNIYNAMLKNQNAYEKNLADLKTLCEMYIENLRRKHELISIKPFIRRVDIRNGENGSKNVMGVSTSKEFRIPTSKVNKENLANYKVCRPRQITFVQTTHNEKVFCNALNDTEEDIVVSSVNEVFECDEGKLLPEYLRLFFNRSEFDRYARFHSWGSAREVFTFEDLENVRIPIPNIATQKSISDISKCFYSRGNMLKTIREEIKNICPILIKGSLEEANK